MNAPSLTLCICVLATQSAFPDDEKLYTQRGSDPTFEEIIKSGKLPQGRNSTNGIRGSSVNVQNKLIETTPEAKRRIDSNIRIHTLGNSFINRSDFDNWSRWYQEDGSTQVFRLFKDEKNVRNSRDLAARVEAFSITTWERGEWNEWSGTYTIIKPLGCAIFQAKNDVNDWSVQLNMSSSGDVMLNHRRGNDQKIASDMVGKPFHIRVRDNGHDYEVYFNGAKVGSGSYARPKGTNTFRWGMYLGGNPVSHDGMIFVSGATVNAKNGR